MRTGKYPFSSDSAEDLMKEIKNGHILFPGSFDEEEQIFFKNVLVLNPNERITIQKIIQIFENEQL